MKTPAIVGAAACLLLVACDSIDVSDVPKIPGPSKKVTRAQAIEIARTYARMQWTPEERHAFHGKDVHKVTVHTPDADFRKSGLKSGYWKAGQTEKGMPYKWGGFDTPRSFARGLHMGRFAGDVATKEKRQLLDMAASPAAVGIDCSGFVSRCWRLKKPYSTRDLHSISEKLASYDDLQSGDILNLKDKHVLLFSHWVIPNKMVYVYEAGAYPDWKVSGNRIWADWLKGEGYVAYRYQNIRDGHPGKAKSPAKDRSDASTVVKKEASPPAEKTVPKERKRWKLPAWGKSLGEALKDKQPEDTADAPADEQGFKKSAARRRK